MRNRPIRRIVGIAASLTLSFGSSVEAGETVDKLSQHNRFEALQSDIGREPDRSEAGGACGGIVIHDWIDENVRVITLGETVQAVSELEVETKP